MATYHVSFSEVFVGGNWVNEAMIQEVASPPSVYGTYSNWSDFYSAIGTLRTSHTIVHDCGGGDSDKEFIILKEQDLTFTVQRKDYVNDVFVGYVNVESGFATVIGAIDRINYIYANGTPYHQGQISVLDINTLGGCPGYWD